MAITITIPSTGGLEASEQHFFRGADVLLTIDLIVGVTKTYEVCVLWVFLSSLSSFSLWENLDGAVQE